MKKTIFWIIGIILSFFIGCLLCKHFTKSEIKTVVKYLPGEPHYDTIFKPVLIDKIIPIDTCNIIQECILSGKHFDLFPKVEKIIYVPSKIDTLNILKDWASKKYYNETLFDIDTLGKCNVTIVVQYNQIDTLQYEYYPICKEISNTIIKQRLFEPFIGIGALSDPIIFTQVGTYIKGKYGLSIIAGYDFNQNVPTLGGSINYKF